MKTRILFIVGIPISIVAAIGIVGRQPVPTDSIEKARTASANIAINKEKRANTAELANFEAIKDYIKKNGDSIQNEGSVPHYWLRYHDNMQGRHSMLTDKVDFDTINVIASYPHSIFSYQITKSGMELSSTGGVYTQEDSISVRKFYKDFCVKIK